jgi:hypothetical protein
MTSSFPCVCVWEWLLNQPIFMKFSMNIMPLEAILTSYFLTPCHQYHLASYANIWSGNNTCYLMLGPLIVNGDIFKKYTTFVHVATSV